MTPFTKFQEVSDKPFFATQIQIGLIAIEGSIQRAIKSGL